MVPLRGYENASTEGGSATEYLHQMVVEQSTADMQAELRYPISMNQTAKIFALTFAEAGNTWNNYSSFNPFQLK